MRLAVCICTRNRAESLRRTLECLALAKVPPGSSLTITVVDNGSEDQTPRVLRELARRLPIQAIHEPRPGLGAARNGAVSAALGDLLVWTDDDVLVDPWWLEAYHGAALARPSDQFFGGPIRPRFDGEPPHWLARGVASIGPAYGALGPHPDGTPFTSSLVPFGANMAIRTSVFRSLRFREDLGWRGEGGGIPFEETVLLRGILASGETGSWVAAAGVDHVIPRSRQSLSHLKRYFYGVGLGDAMLSHEAGEVPRGARWIGRYPRWLLRAVVEAELRSRWARLASPPEVWLRRRAISWNLRGQLAYWRREGAARQAKVRLRGDGVPIAPAGSPAPVPPGEEPSA